MSHTLEYFCLMEDFAKLSEVLLSVFKKVGPCWEQCISFRVRRMVMAALVLLNTWDISASATEDITLFMVVH